MTVSERRRLLVTFVVVAILAWAAVVYFG